MKYETRELIEKVTSIVVIGGVVLFCLMGVGREIVKEIRFAEQMQSKCFIEKGYWDATTYNCIFPSMAGTVIEQK